MNAHDETALPRDDSPRPGALHWAVLAPLCLLPAFQTVVTVYLEFHSRITYPLLKAAIIAAPLVAWAAMRRRPRDVLADIGLKRTNCLGGLATGVIFLVVILGGYYAWLRGFVDAGGLGAKLGRFRAGTPLGFWTLAMFLSLANSLMEEYYWRGFLLDQLRRRFGGVLWLSLLAGGLFGLHHIFVFVPTLGAGVGGLITLVTVAAGVVWSWQRLRGWSLWDCWVSHILADLAGAWAAWDAISRSA